MKYTEKWMQARLWDFYYNEHKYLLQNIYFFNDLWECDSLHFLENGICIEYEIKVKHYDFLDDFKKVEKHEMLKRGEDCANKFFYVAPFDMIKVEELPPYAGLIEINEERVRIRKGAPILHKNLWNPALRYERIYKRLRDYVNKDMNETLRTAESKRKNKTAYKKKKFTPKEKFPPQEKFIGQLKEGEEYDDKIHVT